jgi:hypothetical protein
MRTVPMFASPAVHTRRSALAAQLRRKYFGIRQISSRDLAVQHDENHPCWKAAHFLPCTRPPDVMRMHRPPRRATFGPSQRRAFVVTRSGFQTMPSGGLGDDEDTATGASFGNVRQSAPLAKPADLQTALAPPEENAFGTKIYIKLSMIEWPTLSAQEKQLHAAMRKSFVTSYAFGAEAILQHWLWKTLKNATKSVFDFQIFRPPPESVRNRL